MNLPTDFINNITNAFGEDGRRFLADLPALLDMAAARWELSIGAPFLLSYNYVCAATRASGQDVVLKIGVPNCELTSEMHALRLYDGDGAVRLIDCDPQRGMLIEERLQPGTMLATLDDDNRATEIAADVMNQIRRPVPSEHAFITLRGWFDGLGELRARFAGGTGPFAERLVAEVESIVAGYFAEPYIPVVLHGDFHHYNILRSGEHWVVIDPKGVVGPREYEVGPLLINPWSELLRRPDVKRLTERRMDILRERLGCERRRIRDWALAHSVLSAWWDLTDNGTGSEYAIACAEMFSDLK